MIQADKITECKKCRAKIWFAQINESNIPVDLNPISVPKPGMYISENGKFEKYDIGQQAYVSHFSTCPYAAHFRKRSYSKRKSEKSIEKNILLKDIAGIEVILSKCKTLDGLKNKWSDPDLQSALRNLSNDDIVKVISYKELMKQKLKPKQIEMQL